MTDRILIGYHSGEFKFRVSAPGKSVHSSNLDDFNIHEQFFIYRGVLRGTIDFTANGWKTISLSVIEGATRVIVQSITDNELPSRFTYFAYLVNNTELRILNYQNTPRTIRYCVFGNVMP